MMLISRPKDHFRLSKQSPEISSHKFAYLDVVNRSFTPNGPKSGWA